MISRRGFLASALAAPAAMRAQERRPNIVLILADDLGYGELGCQGANVDIPTPHIDSIAEAGVRFTSGYVSAPYCCPSRAGLMTGRYQTRFGHELNAIGRQNLLPGAGLPLSETTMATVLHEAGYATGMCGKWHLGGTPPFHPQRRGFDDYFGFLHEGHFYEPAPYRGLTTRLRANEPPYDDANPLMRGTEPIEEPGYLTGALTREAVAFIDRNAAKPFFLYVPYNAVHSPMQALVSDVRRFQDSIHDEQRRVFAGMLAQLDEGVGQILGALRKHGLEENTLFIFLSDNGGPTAELTSSNKPLRGGKGQLYEGGIRIPFLMQWKGTIPASKTLDAPVSALDLLPTIAAVAGAKLPLEPLDGVNILPYAAGKSAAPERASLFWRYGPNLALRKGKWKLVKQGNSGFQLFDLLSDLGESHDLTASQPEVAASMRRELDALNAQMVPPLWGAR